MTRKKATPKTIAEKETASTSEADTTVPRLLELDPSFDVSVAPDVLASVKTWFEGLEGDAPATVRLPDIESVITVQLAAAIVRSGRAKGISVRVLDPEGQAFEALHFNAGKEMAA